MDSASWRMILSYRNLLPLCCSLLWLLLDLVSSEDIIATLGSDVTLACNYDAQRYGSLHVCWGRGQIPNSGCAKMVIQADGTAVTSRLSERYLLRGELGRGDVSLTIRQVEEGDSGVYGCRVEIPGWFNDQVYHRSLKVVAARPNPLTVAIREVRERTVTVQWSPVFNGGRPILSYRIDWKYKQASWDTAVITEVNTDLTQMTLMDLRPARTYNFRMFAINSVGNSDSSNVLTIVTKEAAPEGPPLDMTLEALTSRSIKVTWKPPQEELRNGVLRGYTVSYRKYDPEGRHFKQWQQRSVSATLELESIILSDLKPSTMYSVLIQAKTNAGAGPASTAPLCSTLDEVLTTTEAATAGSYSTAATTQGQDSSTSATAVVWHSIADDRVTAATTIWTPSPASSSVPPDPPVVELKEVTDNSISLFWTPGFEGDSPITGFTLEYRAENASWDYTKAVVDFSPNQTEATIIETHPSTYNIRMFARNSQGISNASNVLTVNTAHTGHHQDMIVSTTPSDTHAAAVVEGIGNGHVAAIVIPVILIVLTVAIVTVWKLRRMKKIQTLSLWTGVVQYKGSGSLQQL